MGGGGHSRIGRIKMIECIYSMHFYFGLHMPTVLTLMKENGSACLDTVGAVVVDLEGNVAAAVSSGGLAMKHPGRVGQVWTFLFHIIMSISL